MVDNLSNVLREYGLNQKEASIYLVILELGKAPASTIARQVGLKRVTTYAIIQDMVRKGVLMELDSKGVKLFSVIDPNQLHAQREVRCKAFQSALPEFAALADVRGNKPRIQYFEGFNGILQIYDDMLTSKVDICAFVGVDLMNAALKRNLLENHVKRRVQLGIKAKVICSNSESNIQYKSWEEEQLRETCVVDHHSFEILSELDMYGPDKIAISMFSGDEMSGIIIHSTKLYATLMSLFDYIWAHEYNK